MSRFVFLLARQRSGTNIFCDLIGKHGDIFPCPEIFHPSPTGLDPAQLKLGFVSYLQRMISWRGATAMYQYVTDRHAFFDGFLEYIESIADRPWIIFDIKYNSTHHLDKAWRGISSMPHIFDYAGSRGIKVLNLTRNNFLRFYLSERKAFLTQQWSVHGDVDIRDKERPIVLDSADLLEKLSSCEEENRMVKMALSNHPESMAMEYSEVFPAPGEFCGKTINRFFDWLDIPRHDVKFGKSFRKQSCLPLDQAIENYEEVRNALRGTRFEHFLDDEPYYHYFI